MLHPLTDPVVIKAMAHPLRLQLISLLETDARSPSDLAELLGEPLGKVSYHVRTLARLGLIELVDRQPRRGAVEHYYRLSKRWLIDGTTWGELPDGVKHAVAGSVIHQICSELQAADARNSFDESSAYLTRTPVFLDEQARRELTASLDALLEKAVELERQTLARRGAGSSDGNGDGGETPPDAARVLLIVTLHDTA
jgi:DNA-binding transcriptional ArsR family regulator